MKNIIKALAALFICALLLTSCSFTYELENAPEDIKETKEETTEGKTEKMPDFAVYAEGGEKVTLYEKLEGKKPVVINFWATWCPPCKAELPHFEKLYGEYGDRVEFMMVDMTDGVRDTVESVEEFISDNGYTFPVYFDSDRSAAYTYGVQSIPLTVFMNTDGEMVSHYVGAMSEAQLSSYIESLLDSSDE